MPSLIEAIKKQRQDKIEFKDKGSIESDVHDAIVAPNSDTFSRIANHVPYYFSKTEEAALLKGLSGFLKMLEFSPTQYAETTDMAKLISKGHRDIANLARIEELLLKRKNRENLSQQDNDLINYPPEQPAIYLQVDKDSVQKLREFYIQLLKMIASQVMVFAPEINNYILNSEFINEMGLQHLLKKIGIEKQEELRIYIITSIANNLMMPLLAKFQESADFRADIDLQMRFQVANKAINDMVAKEEFAHREVKQMLGGSLPLEYVLSYIQEGQHDDALQHKILTDPFYETEIRKMDTVKQRNKLVTFFVSKQREHEKGDQIFKYVALHHPGLATQIYKNALQFKKQNMDKQFIYAIKALVRLGEPRLAHQALYGDEVTIPKDPEKLLKSVKENAIKAHMKQEKKSPSM